MTRQTGFSSPLLLGFDDIERALERVSRGASDGYPPYNIERIAASNGELPRIRIVLAVAGFSRDEIDISVDDSELTIVGKQADDSDRDYLHRGIAARQFKRTFVLADGMDVVGADLKDGLLAIDLVRPEPDRKVRKIEISAGNQ
ncbi:MAG TPA: Hsp20 family protein [Afifellaceae bacterium]|nr:Hsp20 family protein [Afifellaceae bacterium]